MMHLLRQLQATESIVTTSYVSPDTQFTRDRCETYTGCGQDFPEFREGHHLEELDLLGRVRLNRRLFGRKQVRILELETKGEAGMIDWTAMR